MLQLMYQAAQQAAEFIDKVTKDEMLKPIEQLQVTEEFSGGKCNQRTRKFHELPTDRRAFSLKHQQREHFTWNPPGKSNCPCKSKCSNEHVINSLKNRSNRDSSIDIAPRNVTQLLNCPPKRHLSTCQGNLSRRSENVLRDNKVRITNERRQNQVSIGTFSKCPYLANPVQWAWRSVQQITESYRCKHSFPVVTFTWERLYFRLTLLQTWANAVTTFSLIFIF